MANSSFAEHSRTFFLAFASVVAQRLDHAEALEEV